MTPDLTAQQIREAVDPSPGSELNSAIPPFGTPIRERWNRLCTAALAYADLLDRIKSGDTIRIDKTDGEWPQWANRVIDAWREGETENLWNELAKGGQG